MTRVFYTFDCREYLMNVLTRSTTRPPFRYRDPNYMFYQLLRPEEIKPEEKMLIAIDTEFVALSRVSLLYSSTRVHVCPFPAIY